MQDIFHEQIIKKQPNTKDLITKVVTIIIALLVLAVSMMIEVLAFFIIPILLVVVVAVIFVFRRLNVEYEYIVTNTDLDIDRITNQYRRKRLFTLDVKQITVMTKVSEMDKSTEFRTAERTIDISSGVKNEMTYAFVIPVENKRTCFIFEPNEDIYKALKRHLRSRII